MNEKNIPITNKQLGWEEGNEMEQAVTELVKVQAFKTYQNTTTAELQYYYLYYLVYVMI